MSAPDLSVILCTHDPRSAPLARVLRALADQTLPIACWELLLIDNASSVPVCERVEFADLWPVLPVRFVREMTLGLTPARLRGFADANAPLLVLIDDDTVPAADYLAQCLKVFAAQAELGAVGGRIAGEFDRTPPVWASEVLDCLAIRDFGDRPIRALIHNSLGPWEPCGAGMALRRSVAQAYAVAARAPQRKRLDRVGKALTSCGDTDLARTASDLGMYLGYEPTLRLTHLIPEGRLHLRYLTRLVYSIQRDGWLLLRLRALHGRPMRPLARWVRTLQAPFATFALRPQRWLLRLAARLGQLHGRALPIEPDHD